MTATLEHRKITNCPSGEKRKYISYFQTVTTVGIISTASDAQEAAGKAKRKITDSSFACGVIGQTPFEHSATEEWSPEFMGFVDNTSEGLSLDLGDNTKERIARQLGKSVNEVSESEIVAFVNSALLTQLK